jgi:hypothetical protein
VRFDTGVGGWLKECGNTKVDSSLAALGMTAWESRRGARIRYPLSKANRSAEHSRNPLVGAVPFASYHLDPHWAARSCQRTVPCEEWGIKQEALRAAQLAHPHQPSMSRLSDQATDIDIHAKEILRMRSVINRLLADHSGQPMERIEQDVERDFIMSAQQAKEYGLIDEIIQKHR